MDAFPHLVKAIAVEENEALVEYVLTDTADEILLSKTDDIQDKMFVCSNFDIEDALDYLVYRTMHASLTVARLVASKETILNTLDHINNEDYEYFQD